MFFVVVVVCVLNIQHFQTKDVGQNEFPDGKQ